MKHSFKNSLMIILTLTSLMINAVGVTPALAAEVPTVVVVSPATPNWAFSNEGTATGAYAFVNGPADHSGSLQLTTAVASDGPYFLGVLAGFNVDELTTLQYDVFSPNPTGIMPTLQLDVDWDSTDAITGWQGRLVFVANGPFTEGTWETINALSDTDGTWFGTGGAGKVSCPLSAPCTWSTIQSTFPNLVLYSSWTQASYPGTGAVGFKKGSSETAPFEGYVDNLVIDSVTYDFELTIPAPTLTLDYTSWDFDDVPVGYYGGRLFVLTNTGTADLVIDELQITDSDFSIGLDSCGGSTIASSDSCYLIVFFGPSVTGAASGSISISSNAASSPDIIELSGNGIDLPAPTIWSGPTTTFTKANYADWTDPANQDRLTDNVWLTRADAKGLFNIKEESEFSDFSPSDTEWAFGTLENYDSLSYEPWGEFNGWTPPDMVGQDAVLHLISENIYLSIKFTAWTQGANGGGFSYERSTPSNDPAVDLSSSFFYFGGQAVGASVVRTVTLTNSGTADLIIDTLSIHPIEVFSLSDDLCSGQTVAPSESCTFDITFSPDSTGEKYAWVEIPSNAPSLVDSVDMSGFGTASLGTGGYTMADSNEAGGPDYDFEDILETGTVIGPLGDDDMSSAIPLGFDFSYFGTTYSEVYVSSNGFLTVLPDQSAGCCDGMPMPYDEDPNGVIAGWWSDLYPGENSTISYQTLGSAPNRRLVVQFDAVETYGIQEPVTMQFKLFEGSNIIEVHYENAPADDLYIFSAGIEDETGTLGLEYFNNIGSLAAPLAVRYTPGSAPSTYTVSGALGANGADASIAFTGGSPVTADEFGDYSFTVDSGWTGTITPTKPGYTFTPASITVSTPVTADLTDQDFTTAVLETQIDSHPTDPSGSDVSFSFSSPNNGVSFECKLDSGAFGTCTSPKTYTGLSDGLHTFEVRARVAAGNVDITPASFNWTIETAPTVPAKAILTAPSGNISTNSPAYSWNKVSNATSYYLWINNSAGNVFKQWYSSAQVNCNETTCSVTPAGLTLKSGNYTWWVQTRNEVGLGTWSAGMNFSVPAPSLPGKATLTSPNTTITDQTPLYTWEEVSGSSWYYLWVDGPSGNVIKQWYKAIDVCSSGTCSIEDPTVLSSGTYTWWIQTWNEAGMGPWSDGMDFGLPAPELPGKAALTSPNGPIGMKTPAYTWDEVSGSSWYYLWVNGPSGTVIKQWYKATDICSGGTCAVTNPTVLSSGTYTWWVQTWNAGGTGPWSDGMNFTFALPAKASLTAPTGSLNTNTPAYTWQEVPGATWYYLWVNGPAGNVIKQWYTSVQANCDGTTCSVTPTTTLSSGAQTWWIQTWNEAGYGPWSDAMKFDTP